jgi:hypothetical protein
MMIILFLVDHAEAMLSHALESAIYCLKNSEKTETVLLRGMERSINWTKATILRNASAIQANCVDFGVITSFWAYGHDEVWAPTMLSIAMMYFMFKFLMSSTDDEGKQQYVPKRYRKPSKAISSLVSIWRWSSELLSSKLAKSQTYRFLARCVDTWWRRPRNKRFLGCSRTRYSSGTHGNRRTQKRKKKRRSTHRKWDPYSRRGSRYFDAEEDHFWKADQFDSADHPYYFDASQFETELEAYEGKFDDATQFDPSDDEDEGMYVEFFDVSCIFGDGNDIEFSTDFEDMVAMNADMSTREQREDYGYDSDSFWIAVDNCCSKCITNCLSDFVTPPTRVNVDVRGIGGSVTASLMGTVKWSIEDDDGVVHSFLIHNTFYNADSPYRLLSPQHLAQELKDDFPKERGTWCGTFGNAIELYWDQRKYQRTITLSIASNIGLFRSAPGYSRFHAFCHEIGDIEPSTLEENVFYCMPAAEVSEDDSSVLDPDGTGEADADDDDSVESKMTGRRHPDIPDDVFTPIERTGVEDIIPEDKNVQQNTPQAELLAWHYRLGHTSFAKIKEMAARGDLPRNIAACKTPKCASCLYGKATRRAWRSKSPANKMTTPQATAPGKVVAVDQMISATPGLIAQMRGFITGKRYKVTTVFVDHFSGLSFVYLQKSTSAAETVEAKRAFERYAKLQGVKVQHYHADNGIFSEAEFTRAVETDQQTITYCAVNAHHQNGQAEKKIRDLQELARTMLLHAKQRWPNAVSASLWPYAMRMANDVSNFSPGILDGVSPQEKFSQVTVAPRVKHCHTFGSPVYVLDRQLQEGRSIPKWTKKSRIGLYLGASPRHSRRVALVLNLETGHVSPQFHVVFDDLFETLRPSAGNPAPESRWQVQTGFVQGKKSGRTEKPGESQGAQQQDLAPGIIPPTDTSSSGVTGDTPYEQPDNDDAAELGDEAVPVDAAIGRTRSGRAMKPTQKWLESVEQRDGVEWAEKNDQQLEETVAMHVSWEVFHDGGYQIQDEMEDPIAFAASANPDIMYYDQAMKAPDSKQFEQAMLDEVQTHTDLGNWEIVHKDEIPAGTKLLPAVWAMRRKRRISTQEPYKWKARLNVHGGKQEHGVNYWETYSPVVSWTTIRLYLTLSLLNNWCTRQVDFVLAFPQADIECPMFMEIPRGFKFNGSRRTHCLSLKKNLYGQKQAGRVWNEYLHDGLVARGFKQSEVDLCLYHRGSVSLLLYVDDGIFVGPSQKDIDEAYNILVEPFDDHPAFKMTDEGTLGDYLGVKIDYLENGTIKLSQPHLIQQILDDLGFNERTGTKPTPAATSVKLSRDLHGEPFNEDWHYRSVIGKLNFLEKSTRLDIAYAVHQCARFSTDPKASHAAAIKRLGKYLLGTKDKGLILNPQETHSFDCWVDADFCGNWDRVNADVDPSTAKSRTGYIITYAACPIVWASKLQPYVALSTSESEYGALSTSLRDVIHMMQIVKEAGSRLEWKTFEGKPTVHCKAFEDNSGALEWARLPKMRTRTKHLNIRLHHFREHVRAKHISINKIPTRYQLGDIATKPQPEDLFVSQRESLMQWEAEFMTKEELSLPAHHMRACDINAKSQALCEENQSDDAVRSEKEKAAPRSMKTNISTGQKSDSSDQRKVSFTK